MFTSIEQIRSEGNLPDTIEAEVLNPHLDKAAIDMKKILTAEKCSDIVNGGADSEDYKTCSIAEANLTLSYAITSLNVETHGSGIVRSKGFDESRSDLLSQSEVEKLREYYRGIAMDLLESFIPQKTGSDSIDVMRGSDYKMIAL